MRWIFIFSLLLLTFLVSILGCTTNGDQVNKKDAVQATVKVKNENREAQQTNREPQGKNGIPLLLSIPKYNATQTELVEERALLGYWDVRTGSISLEKKALPKDKFSNDPRFNKSDGSTSLKNEVGKFKPPLPENASDPCQLLLSGSPKDFIVLAGYDDLSKDGVTGNLLLGSFNGSNMNWRKVEGTCLSLTAAYTPDVIKIGDRIYIDDKSGFTAKAVDLKEDKLELADYVPANRLISQVKNTLDAPEIPPLSFGSHQDILLVELGGNTKFWIWAIQNDMCIGKVYMNTKEKELVLYRGDKVIDKKILPELPDGIRLPRE